MYINSVILNKEARSGVPNLQQQQQQVKKLPAIFGIEEEYAEEHRPKLLEFNTNDEILKLDHVLSQHRQATNKMAETTTTTPKIQNGVRCASKPPPSCILRPIYASNPRTPLTIPKTLPKSSMMGLRALAKAFEKTNIKLNIENGVINKMEDLQQQQQSDNLQEEKSQQPQSNFLIKKTSVGINTLNLAVKKDASTITVAVAKDGGGFKKRQQGQEEEEKSVETASTQTHANNSPPFFFKRNRHKFKNEFDKKKCHYSSSLSSSSSSSSFLMLNRGDGEKDDAIKKSHQKRIRKKVSYKVLPKFKFRCQNFAPFRLSSGGGGLNGNPASNRVSIVKFPVANRRRLSGKFERRGFVDFFDGESGKNRNRKQFNKLVTLYKSDRNTGSTTDANSNVSSSQASVCEKMATCNLARDADLIKEEYEKYEVTTDLSSLTDEGVGQHEIRNKNDDLSLEDLVDLISSCESEFKESKSLNFTLLNACQKLNNAITLENKLNSDVEVLTSKVRKYADYIKTCKNLIETDLKGLKASDLRKTVDREVKNISELSKRVGNARAENNELKKKLTDYEKELLRCNCRECKKMVDDIVRLEIKINKLDILNAN